MVYYDLTESTYVSKYKDLNLYFSTERRMLKFETEVENYVKLQCDLFQAKYRMSINKDYLENFFALAFYQRVEKRGFYFTSDKYTFIEDVFT